MKQTAHNPVLLSLGGNLGNTEEHFHQAERALEENGFHVLKISKVYHSHAVDCEPGAPDFLNIAILGEWQETPEKLLALTRKTEAAEGRPNDHLPGHSRTLDIDIVLMGDLISENPRLILPHPRFQNRDFVLVPSAEIASELPVPGTDRTVGDFLALLRKKQGITG